MSKVFKFFLSLVVAILIMWLIVYILINNYIFILKIVSYFALLVSTILLWIEVYDKI